MRKYYLQIALVKPLRDALEQAAQELGFLVGRGRYNGRGNITTIIRAVASALSAHGDDRETLLRIIEKYGVGVKAEES